MRGKKTIELELAKYSKDTDKLVREYNQAFGQEDRRDYQLFNIRMRNDMKEQVESKAEKLGINTSNFIRLAIFKLMQDV